MDDWDDQDFPPELVETGTELKLEEKPVKVPITIVTGKCTHNSSTLVRINNKFQVIWEQERPRSSTIFLLLNMARKLPSL